MEGLEMETTERAQKFLDWRPTSGFWYTVTKSDDEELVMEGVLAPHHEGPPIHTHEHISDTFEIRSGTVDVWMDGGWREVKAGETFTVEPGEYHTTANHHDEPAEIVNIHRPPGRMEEFFTKSSLLVRTGKVKSIPPKDPRSLFLLAILFDTYRDDIRVLKPPPWAFRTLAWIGRLLGFRLPKETPA
jgi:mannose-6-phosphate isomerase-like protein (cupin superfamily)